ncbi:hypothetical protein AKJ50_01865 [candidate division MSBL1 archaeon SCGC-AAA382A13]|uniref:Small ribosomal subunit protein eS24 n=1 Tax=candidate division MSBL1 archaeon SCGC-AAA382A13 TaxID=1698279 RepID=A0A133VEU2_9EURY|nr:hypothetical protein AKJ50_01865 [candidate division MSBL1 archaeon SCGC-AAA382A13]
MKVNITKKIENPLMERTEIEFEVEHNNASTPSRAEVVEELSSKLDISEDLIIIEKITTPHGRQKATGNARTYKSQQQLRELESEYLIERTKISKEKTDEETEETKEEEE